MGPVRVLSVVGNRPQFVKAASVSRRLRATHDETLVHTGQHWDPEMSDVFFTELDLPEPEVRLELGGGTNTAQTARMLDALAPVVDDAAPDVLLVYGDTNTTLAGGLVAAQAGIPVAHVEAGQPEELNRVLVDRLSSLLLCPSAAAVAQLEREAVPGRAEVVGDVMVDVAELIQPRARERTEPLELVGVEPGGYALCTAHRAGTVDDPARLAAFVELVTALPLPVVLPLHPRTRARLDAAGLAGALAAGDVRVLPPLGMLDFTTLLVHASRVLTDSGGVQKEAYLAGVPCLTLRSRTEWTETVDTGWNTLVDLNRGATLAALEVPPPAERPELYGDGNAGARVVAAIEREVDSPSVSAWGALA